MEPLVVSVAEIAQLLGVRRARVHQLVKMPDFPAPVAVLGVGKVWLTTDVMEWAERHGRVVHDLPPR